MNDAEYNKLRAESWRRKLDHAEQRQAQAYWADHPHAQAEWEDDLALTRQLRELPHAPISSNFTALVLQAVDAETESARQSTSLSLESRWRGWLSRFVPRIALAVLAVSLGVAVFFQQQGHTHNKRVAGELREFVRATNLPGPEVFEDFDAIQQLQPVSISSNDDDLLAALR